MDRLADLVVPFKRPVYERVAHEFGRFTRGSIVVDSLTLFGLFAVTSMMICYALESRSHWFVLAFAATCVLASAYGSCRAPGRSAWSKRSGRWLRCGAVGQEAA